MFNFAFPTQTPLRQAVTDAYRRDEIEAVQDMLQRAQMTDEERNAASELARRLVTQVRASRTKASGVDALMHEFSLSSEEGVALMCLAEALLRIPDNATRDRLIADKISEGNWKSHLNVVVVVAVGILFGVCGFTQHIEREAVTHFLALFTVLQRFFNGLAGDELFAQQAHGVVHYLDGSEGRRLC